MGKPNVVVSANKNTGNSNLNRLVGVLQKWGLPAVLLGPFLILITVFFIAPVVLIVILAFTNMDSSMVWDLNGLLNFKKMASDPNLGEIMLNTVFYVTLTLSLNIFLGLSLALLTTYFIKQESVGLIIRTIWMLPRISPPVVYILLWLWFFDPSQYGVLNSLRMIFDMPPANFLADQPMTAIVLANGLIGASYGMIIFSAAIKSIPGDLFMAARVDGAAERSIIFDIIIPAVKWPLMFVTLWQLLSLLTSYEYILLLTKGGPLFETEVLALYSYHKAFQSFEYGYGSAVALVLVVIALICTFIFWRIFGMDKMIKSSRIE
ncbi:carbohydrate ABC transporter membrane protein 1, CUT1 family [Paenibacillaceae bacterium GAS479]|nr:carbohydrate ABC transporter membrane protein 1, CUT1 family [Paenibacillaceae bacterium GAS479]